ncbi:TylF/MycF/NovP-related O-methyltransferase [Acidisphaera rubrifaciens]|uniref:Class I SAM-dependent methyltransferase n=1 Tax=Acidisphaera rubrifaciens HS-AP3 TaxID=1231350 RepID=A0A0D6PAS1_9PROT|nr:TylF/MycF/NovP-related O-methyltransferase [Acidisphaera rubrifaciens]GAN78293.1 hypothetical protein Asru_0729_02 [Acidisphaera rubrifaciens HS-AP3]
MKGLSSEERHRRAASALADIYWTRPATTVLPRGDRSALYDCVADQIGPNVPVNCLEFGVGQGASITALSRLFVHPRARFIGFDSFAAPPGTGTAARRGSFVTDGHPPATADTRVTFRKGWFQDTVPDYFRDNPVDRTRILLVHFDADLYASDLFLLTTLWHLLGSYFFIFDDFIHDDVVALADFMQAYPVKIAFLAQTTGGEGRPYPERVFGHMKRTEMPAPLH